MDTPSTDQLHRPEDGAGRGHGDQTDGVVPERGRPTQTGPERWEVARSQRYGWFIVRIRCWSKAAEHLAKRFSSDPCDRIVTGGCGGSRAGGGFEGSSGFREVVWETMTARGERGEQLGRGPRIVAGENEPLRGVFRRVYLGQWGGCGFHR